MKIRTRLALQFTIIVASLLIVFAAAVYYFSSSFRESNFYERLSEKSGNYAQLIAEVDQVKPGLTKLFDKNTAYLKNERILIYNAQNELLFNTIEDVVPTDLNLLNRVRKEKLIKYMQGKDEVIASLHQFPSAEYVVIVSAFDEEGYSKLNNLKWILALGLLICVLVTMIAGWIYAGQALSPISGVVEQVERTTATHLSERVDIGNGKDEIAQLAITFNAMLERLQKSFELQKSFVSNSSHELRTPLTSITGQIEVALMNDRDATEYRQILVSILEDVRNINRLTNGLLELAQTDMDFSRLKMKPLRIDELLWQTRNELLRRNPDYTIIIDRGNFPESENEKTIVGNEHLLRSALINIMDNACKFSSKKEVVVKMFTEGKGLTVQFTDQGIGISQADIQKITEPFYRGSNAKNFQGHGLGLSLTSKIIALHKAELNIQSEENKFTEVSIRFPL